MASEQIFLCTLTKFYILITIHHFGILSLVSLFSENSSFSSVWTVFSLKFHDLILHYCIVVRIFSSEKCSWHITQLLFRFFVFGLQACIHEYYRKYCVNFQILQKSETDLLLLCLIFLILFLQVFQNFVLKKLVFKTRQNHINQLLNIMYYKFS